MTHLLFLLLFFFNDTATTEIYTLSLHDALPISFESTRLRLFDRWFGGWRPPTGRLVSLDGSRLRLLHLDPCQPNRISSQDRKSTRLNSSHANISYAVFCLKTNNHIQLVSYGFSR